MLPLLLCLISATQSEANLAAGRRIGAKGAAIRSPDALRPFFRELRALEQKSADDNVVVSVFGNSLISGDNIVDIVRKRLQERFGDGGRGLLFAESLKGGNHRRAATATGGGWTPFSLAMGPKGVGRFALSGVFHESTRAAVTEWTIDGEPRADFFWLDQDGAPLMDLRADGVRLALIAPEGSGRAKSIRLRIPEGTKRVTLHASGAHAISYGLALERDVPGVMLDNYGLPAAEAGKFLTADADAFSDQVKTRRPKLVVFMLGGNEGRRLTWSRVPQKASRSRIPGDLARLIDRATQSVPETACLVVGPIDSVEDDSFTTQPHVRDVIAIERRVAEEKGCAFFDLFQAMGGEGSLARFHARGWLHEDRVHPQGRGLDVLGELIASGLLRAYDESLPQLARNTARAEQLP